MKSNKNYLYIFCIGCMFSRRTMFELFMIKLHSSLLELLACPVTKGKLVYDEVAQELISLEAGLAFPIIDGVPIMLASEAKKVSSRRLEMLCKKK